MTAAERPNRIKEIRKERGITAIGLAEQLGVREVTVFRYESGDTVPSLATAKRIAELLAVTLDDLFPSSETEIAVAVK